MSDEQQELKNCPFCGITPEIGKYKSRYFVDCWQVGCENIDCPVEVSTASHATTADAVSAWNTRTPQPSEDSHE